MNILNIPATMRKPRRPRMTSKNGEAWYYISPNGLEVCVASEKGRAADTQFTISRNQLYRAIQILKETN